MRTTIHSPASALSAIAAALALSTTAAYAQDTASGPLYGPIVNVPSAPTAPDTTATTTPILPTTTAPAPVIILPEVSTAAPATATSTPTTSPAAQATTASAPRPAVPAATTPTRVAERTAQPASRPTTIDTPPVSSADAAPAIAAEPVAVAEPTEVAPLAAEPATEAAPTPTQTRDATGILALVLIGLIGLAVAAFGLLAFRRRPKKAYRAAPVIEKPIVERRAATIDTVAPTQPIAAEPIAPSIPVATATPFEARNEPLATSGATVALPSRMPQTYEERDALLKRMVAAKPDRANPFHSYKARVHRARLILQSLNRKFENARPWIDLSQYSRNWPALARRPVTKAA